MQQQDLTHKIIGAAYNVYNELGFGFLENVYKNAMVIELKKQKINVEVEKPLAVYYDNQNVGDYIIDLFVEDQIVVELKAIKKLITKHEVQLVNYLHGIRKDIGLLINFGPNSVNVKRKYRKAQT